MLLWQIFDAVLAACLIKSQREVRLAQGCRER